MKKTKIIAKNKETGTKYVSCTTDKQFPGQYIVKTANSHGRYLVHKDAVKLMKK